MSEQTPPTSVETPASGFAVFLSHNSLEKPVVKRIAEKLKREKIEPWFDAWCLTSGGDWQNELAEGLRASATCAVFVGANGIGNWEDLEYKLATDRMAKDRAFRLFLVLLPGLPEPFDASALPPFLSIRTWVDLRRGIEDARAFQSLISAIKGLPLGPERPIEPRNDICPYRGLQTFDEAHAEFFFGRDADIQRLIEKLKRTRFLTVIGPSGSGKSSLVRAGVIPALKRGVLPESDTWQFRIFTPGAHPLTALAANLLRLYPQEAMHKTLDQMSADERTLHLAVSLSLAERPQTERVVWVVDQFEEVFTLCQDQKEREQFIANLLYASSMPDGRNVVVLTLRADFYHKCAAFPELSARIAAQQFLVSLMGADNLRQAIEEPAWHTGLEFEQGLVGTILEAVENQPGALPLLEHALLELWERRRGTMLTLEAYRESGGVEGAIAKRADAIYEGFDAEQQRIARRIMLRLTQPGEGTEDTRRRATMSELITRTDESGKVEGVAQALANARLLTTDSDAEPDKQIVDVSHEALIRGWPRLRRWIEEDRAGLRILRRLTEVAREWQPTKDESLLYRGARLAQAVEWRERNEDALNETERRFLNASVGAQQAVERRRKRVIIGLAAGLLIAIALAVLALFQWRRANEQTQTALSKQLAAQSYTQMENQPALGLLLGIEANRIEKSFDARNILLLDMQYREYLTAYLHGHTAEVHKVVFSPDGKLLASASGSYGQDSSVRLWDADSGQPIGQPLMGHQHSVWSVAFSPDGKILASSDIGGVIRLWDVATHNAIGQLTGHHGGVSSLAFSPDNKTLASGSVNASDEQGIRYKGEIYLWDIATHERIGEFLKGHDSGVFSLAFSPDGKTLASGGAGDIRLEGGDGGYSIILWDASTHQALGTLPLKNYRDAVNCLAFSPDGRVLASGAGDGIRLWDVAARKPLEDSELINSEVSEPHTTSVLDVRFSPDGKTLLSGDAKNHVLVRQVEFLTTEGNKLSLKSSELLKALPPYSYSREMQSIAFNPDASRWAVGGCRKEAAGYLCAEGEVSIWNTATPLSIGQSIAEKSDAIQCVAFSPDGKTLASGTCRDFGPDCIDGAIRFWDAATRQPIGQPLTGAPYAVNSLAYSPDGKILAVSGSAKYEGATAKQGEIRLWNTNTLQNIPPPLTGHRRAIETLVFSPTGEILASTDGYTIILWSVATNQPLGEIKDRALPDIIKDSELPHIDSIAFSPDGKILASGGCANYGERSLLSKQDQGCVEGEIRLWDVATRQLLGQPLIGHKDTITSVAFSPDGKTVASASGVSDGTIKLWDLATRQPIGQDFTGGRNIGVKKIIFSPDGETLASASDDSRGNAFISLWDVNTRQLIGNPFGGSNIFQAMAFSPDGSVLASGGGDGTLLFWNLKMESWIENACRIANRNLTHAEWEHYFPDQPYHKTCPNLP